LRQFGFKNRRSLLAQGSSLPDQKRQQFARPKKRQQFARPKKAAVCQTKKVLRPTPAPGCHRKADAGKNTNNRANSKK